MKVDELTPRPTGRVTFKLESFRKVPPNSGCYVLSTYDEDILYIGLSDNLFARFQQHLENPEKTSTTKEGRAVWFHYMKYGADNLPKLERTWLNHYAAMHGRLPILNKVSSPLG